jgi:hypothetical protein
MNAYRSCAKGRGCLFVAAAFAATVLFSSSSRAEGPDAGDGHELARAAALIEQSASDAQGRRGAALVAGLATAAVVTPPGVALVLRSDDVPHTIGVGLTATAGGAIVVSALSLRTSAAERFRDAFQARRASGMAPSELLHRTEEEWSELAASSARFRGSAGAIETAFGGLLAVAGGVLLLAPSIGGIEQNKQYSIGSILVGSGVPFLSLGIHTLFIKSPEETAWAAYRAGSAASAASGLQVGVAPVVAGGAVVARATF